MLKRGQEVVTKDKVDQSEIRLSLKVDGSEKVILLGVNDYVEVPSHSDFNHKVYPQSCHKIFGNECPLCEAYEAGEAGLKPITRYKFGFYVVGSGRVKFFDASFTQAKKLIKQIKGFSEDIEYGSMFTFDRTGSGKETSYTLNLMAERKLTVDEVELIKECKKLSITDEEFEESCQPVNAEFLKTVLYEGYGIGTAPEPKDSNDSSDSKGTENKAGGKALPF